MERGDDKKKYPSRRRLARELALQYLVSLELSHGDMGVLSDTDEFADLTDLMAQKDFWSLRRHEREDVNSYATILVKGVLENFGEIDTIRRNSSYGFQTERLACTVRNVIRLGIYEMLLGKLNQAAVVINEAIEIAKRYGERESSDLVNAILDKARRNAGLPAK